MSFINNILIVYGHIQPVVTIRRVSRHQSGNQKPYIEEEQTTQWPKEKVQKDEQRSTKHTYKTKDLVTRTPLNLFSHTFYKRVSSVTYSLEMYKEYTDL
jgi:hypothetical protein